MSRSSKSERERGKGKGKRENMNLCFNGTLRPHVLYATALFNDVCVVFKEHNKTGIKNEGETKKGIREKDKKIILFGF